MTDILIRSLSPIWILFGFLFPLHSGIAQVEDLGAELDTNGIRIGEQAEISLWIEYRADEGNVAIQWPTIADTLTKEVEVVARSPIDTLLPEKNADPYLFRQERTLTVTSFEAGEHETPPFRFVLNEEDTVRTGSLRLNISSVEVDTSENAVRDIKGIYSFPFDLWSWVKANWGWIAGGVGVLAVIVPLVIYWRRRKRAMAAEETPVSPPRPIHEVALERLEALEEKKLWQAGHVKDHHVQLSFILRAYIEERFGIHALEQPSESILRALEYSSIDRDMLYKASRVLRLSDMVKFARARPEASENEEALASARAFVEGTRPPADGSATDTGENSAGHEVG